MRQSGWRMAGWYGGVGCYCRFGVVVVCVWERRVVRDRSKTGLQVQVWDSDLVMEGRRESAPLYLLARGGPVFIPRFIPPSIPLPLHLPPPATTCLQATTSVPREMSATEKKAHKGLTFHMAGSPRLKRPDNPRRLD